jgi:hypothetical protein
MTVERNLCYSEVNPPQLHMISLDRVSGVSPDLAAFLSAVGVSSADDLAAAEAQKLHQQLEALGRKRGKASFIPGLVTVRLWIQSAQALVQGVVANTPKPEEIPEAINIDDIPEAEIDYSDTSYAASKSASNQPRANPGDQFPKAQKTIVFEGQAAHPTASELWKSLDKSRFQTLDDYAKQGRGIEPLKRNTNPVTDTTDRVHLDAKGKLSRRTRRGVLYPFPGRAVVGAIISLVWRLAVLLVCVGLPLYHFFFAPEEHRPVLETSIALGLLLVLGCLQLWVISRSRCRVCSCHLFYSKSCFKNSKAHNIPLFGYVASLSLHLLLFQWFRCMYCGTAIRLFGGKAKSIPTAVPLDDDAKA